MSNPLEVVNPYNRGVDVSHIPMEQLWPEVDPQFKPYGHRVMVQLRRVMQKTAGGILLPGSTQETEAWNMQVGKLIAVGPGAYKNRVTGEAWPEGGWPTEGEFVRFARWAGDRITIPMDDGGPPVVVLLMADSDLYGGYVGDPRQIKTFIG